MRLIAALVVRNEADRYLDACLAWIRPQVDELFVFDDRSTDDTVDLAVTRGATVYTRGIDEPNWLESEGLCRQLAWHRMCEVYDPEPGDWVMVIDADQFPLGNWWTDLSVLQDFTSVEAKVPEVFLHTPVSVRVDGYWGAITAVMLAAFQPGDQTFRGKGMGVGSFPSYAYSGSMWRNSGLTLMHYGYARKEDREEKYTRYSAALNNGHSNTHIQSILRVPQLVLWEGPAPEVWRGRR